MDFREANARRVPPEGGIKFYGLGFDEFKMTFCLVIEKCGLMIPAFLTTEGRRKSGSDGEEDF